MGVTVGTNGTAAGQEVTRRLGTRRTGSKSKAGAIQAFEVSYELAKNIIRKVLLLRAQEVHITPKEIFRLAALEGLIPDAEV